MVITDDSSVYSSSFQYHEPANFHPIHRRYPSSIPTIKEIQNRAALHLIDEDNLPNDSNEQSSPLIAHRRDRSIATSASRGQQPSVISPSIVSPPLTRNSSTQGKIKRRRRFMVSCKELKTQFFYPVNAPRRSRSKRAGKYRTMKELDSSMDYINFDAYMSKDLCLNKNAATFQIPESQIYLPTPSIQYIMKAITIDSKNNYILYTPNPTMGKNSVVSTAQIEKTLDKELIKTGKTVIPFSKNSRTPPTHTPNDSLEREFDDNYDTYSLPAQQRRFKLQRTMSLPVRSHYRSSSREVSSLWNLYLRRVVAERIKWRLKHLHDNPLLSTKYPADSQDCQDVQNSSSSSKYSPQTSSKHSADESIESSVQSSSRSSDHYSSVLLVNSDLYLSLDSLISESHSIATDHLFMR